MDDSNSLKTDMGSVFEGQSSKDQPLPKARANMGSVHEGPTTILASSLKKEAVDRLGGAVESFFILHAQCSYAGQGIHQIPCAGISIIQSHASGPVGSGCMHPLIMAPNSNSMSMR